MTTSDIELVRGAWDAFSRGDVTAATAVLDPDVRWYGAGEPDGEGACHNRDEAAALACRALGACSLPLEQHSDERASARAVTPASCRAS